MLVFGEIISIKGHMAKLKLNDYDFDESGWFFMPQFFTKGDKSSNILEIGSEVSAVTNDPHSDGCIIGALYNDEDLSVSTNKDLKIIKFSDGTIIEYDKSSHTFNLNIKGTTNLISENNVNITAPKVSITGDLEVSGNVSDSKSSMQDMRNTFNSHTHGNGNNGANTSTPNSNM